MMKGKIDNQGGLYIERAGKYKEQLCVSPFIERSIGFKYCGDDCPHFGEPDGPHELGPQVVLKICQGHTLVFDKFEDDRKG